MRRMMRRGIGGLAMVVLLMAGLAGPGGGAARAQAGSRTFPETGKTVQGAFLTYWNNHGGLAQIGLPISDEMLQVSDINGKTYTTQYFERAVLELHPENAGTPFAVEGALRGVLAYHARYPELGGAPGQQASAANAYTFPETGMTLGGRFRAYWESHGGLAQFGYPISDEFSEKSALDGKTYVVQYFERAVFEEHPENAPPYDVLLSQLGTLAYQAVNDLSFTDWTGTQITLPKRPERIVCLVALCEDLLYDLGLQPAAVNDRFGELAPFWGDAAKSFTHIGGAARTPNLEDVAAVKPDLIIGLFTQVSLRYALQPIAPLYVMNPGNYADSLTYLRTLGRLTGRNYQAETAAQSLLNEMAAYKAKSPNTKVPLLMFGSTTAFSIFTTNSVFGSVLAAVTNYPWPAPPSVPPSTSSEPGALQYSLEQLLAKDPDVILVETDSISTGNTHLVPQLQSNPVWGQLKAVQAHQAYEVSRDYYLFGRGPRSLQVALSDAMSKIYPETFPAPGP